MNPFIEMSNQHSSWPVIVCTYNLLPWLCHKGKYLLLTTLISDPKQAGINIDVFRIIDGGHAEALGTWGHCMG
jgi:hypothetical protein